MKAILILESSEGYGQWMEITEDMFDKEDGLSFDVGKILGTVIKHGGKVNKL